jgi:hypothetical protein
MDERDLRRQYNSVFGSEIGRRVLWDILRECHLLETSVMPSGNQEATAFREGERNVGLRILAKLDVKAVDDLKPFAEV